MVGYQLINISIEMALQKIILSPAYNIIIMTNRMNSGFMLIIILMLPIFGLSQNVNNTNNDEVKEILEFLNQGNEQLKSTAHKDIIFIVGPTGTGMSIQNFLTVPPETLSK